jgi:hypothetical protein
MLSVTSEESNTSTITVLNLDSSWTFIYNDSLDISPKMNLSRSTYVIKQNFSNTIVYASYQLLITSQRRNGSSVQYSKVEIVNFICLQKWINFFQLYGLINVHH